MPRSDDAAAFARYRTYVELSRDAIACVEFDEPIATSLPVEEQIDRIYAQGYLGDCNQAMADLYGFPSPEAVVGRRLVDLTGGPDDPASREAWRQFVAGGYRREGSATEEAGPDGRPRSVVSDDVGVVEGGLLLCMWRSVTDVTALKATQASLQESEARFRRAEQVAQVGHWEWRRDSGEEQWSTGLCRIYGLEPGSVQPSLAQFLARVHPDDRARIAAAVEAAASHATPYDQVFRVVRPDGEVRTVHSRGEPSLDAAGRVVGLLGAACDVTDLTRAEEERRKLDAKMQQAQRLESLGVLARGVAHDFNNLLTVVTASLEFALAERPGTQLRESLEDAQAACLHAADLNRQILLYSGRVTFAPERVDLNATVRGLSKLMESSLGTAVALSLELTPDLRPLQGNPSQLRQVLLNLVLNASEAIGARPGRVVVRTGARLAPPSPARAEPEPAERSWLYLEVADDGPGMDAATCARVFDPFFTTKVTGRGLGLAAVHGIVRQHDGAIEVASKPGAGTTFTVHLPSA